MGESKRWLHSGFNLLIWLAVILLNIGMLPFSDYGSAEYAKAYRALYDKTQSFTAQEYEPYISQAKTEQAAEIVSLLQEEQQYLEDYKEYLAIVEENAQSAALIFEPGSFAYRNLGKTQAAYAPMQQVTLKKAPSRGITAVLNQPATDVLFILFLFLLCSFFITRDQQKGLFPLLGTTSRGYLRLTYTRLGAVVGLGTVTYVILYASDMVYFYFLYGFGDLGRSIQSVNGMQDCVLPLSAGAYLICHFAVKWLCAVLLVTLCYVTFLLIRHPVEVILILGIFGGLEAVCYFKIDSLSVFMPAKYINFVAGMQVTDLLAQYRNFNVGQTPIGSGVVLTGTAAALLLFALLLLPWAYKRQKQQRQSRLTALWKRFCARLCSWGGKGRSHSLWYFECSKVLRINRGGLVLILFVVFLCALYRPEQIYFKDVSDAQYKIYMKSLSGKATNAKQKYIDDLSEYFMHLGNRLSNLDSVASDEMEQLLPELNKQNAYSRVMQQYQYVAQKENRRMVYDSGYQWLLSSYGRKETAVVFGQLFILIVLLASGIYVRDRERGVQEILQTTYGGRLYQDEVKRRIAIGLYSVCFLILFGLRLASVGMLYGYPGLGWDASSLTFLEWVPDGIPIAMVLLFQQLLFYLIGALFLMVVLTLSRKCKSYMNTLLISLGIGAALFAGMYFG